MEAHRAFILCAFGRGRQDLRRAASFEGFAEASEKFCGESESGGCLAATANSTCESKIASE